MLKTISSALAVALVAASLALGACGDDSGNPSPDTDGSATDAAVDAPLADTTPADLGPAGNLSCRAILGCIDSTCDLNANDYNVCVSGCRISGTHAAQKLFDAYTTCADGALKAACASDCTGSTPSACATCLRRECIDEFLACDGDK